MAYFRRTLLMRSFASSMRAASMPSIVIAFGFRIFFLTILDDNATRFAKDAKVLNAPTAFLGGFSVGATNGQKTSPSGPFA